MNLKLLITIFLILASGCFTSYIYFKYIVKRSEKEIKVYMITQGGSSIFIFILFAIFIFLRR